MKCVRFRHSELGSESNNGSRKYYENFLIYFEKQPFGEILPEKYCNIRYRKIFRAVFCLRLFIKDLKVFFGFLLLQNLQTPQQGKNFYFCVKELKKIAYIKEKKNKKGNFKF